MKKKVKTGIRKKAVMGISSLCVLSMVAAPMAVPAGITAKTTEDTKIIRTYEMRKDASMKEQAQKIARIVKKKIDLPKGKSNLSFETFTENGTVWRFQWCAKDDSWRMEVESDKEGRIIGLYYYKNNEDEESGGKFKYIGKKLESLMEKQLNVLIPETKGHVKITDCWYDSNSGEARFSLSRTVNDILVPDNYLTVRIDCSEGRINRLYGNWDYDVSFPKSENIISKKEAKEAGKKALNMELNYYLKRITQEKEGKDDIIENSVQKTKGILGYVPEKNYLAVDAHTKEVYESRPVYDSENEKEDLAEDASAENASGSTEGVADAGELTPEELEAIEKLDGIMEAEAAAKLVMEKKGLYHPSGMKFDSGRLYRESINDTDRFFWRLGFSIQKDNEEAGSVYAAADAKTGEIISYYMYEYNPAAVANNMTEENLEQAAADYLKENYPQYADKTKCSLSIQDYQYINGEDSLRGYSFVFNRMENGIKCPRNHFTLEVTADKGEIYGIYKSWDEGAEFEGKEGIISEDEAENYYFDSKEFQLVYEINTKKSGNKAARLVYSTERINPGIIKASNGKRMYEWGDIYKEEGQKKYQYSDIDKSPDKEAIMLLSELNIGFESDKFYPDKNITREELIALAEQSSLWRIDWNLLGKDQNKNVTRMELAHIILDSLEYKNALKYSDVFDASFEDWGRINKKDKGYAALSGAMGLFWDGRKHLNGKYEPDKPLTRGEAASLIVTLYRI